MTVHWGLLGATVIAERAVLAPGGSVPGFAAHAVAAGDPARARAFAERHGLPVVHRDYAALIEDPDVDAVYLSLHNSAHARWALHAVARGKHALVEKPLCLTAQEASAIGDAAASTGARVLEAVPTAGHPWQAAVRRLRQDGGLGSLTAVRTEIRFRVPPEGNYRGRRDLGGGIFRDAASYWLQAVQATAGLDAVAWCGGSRFDGPDGTDTEFTAELTLSDGTTATLDCAFDSSGRGPRMEHRFVFEEAEARVRGVLLPLAAAVPLNLGVRRRTGGTEVTALPAVRYYDHQLLRAQRLFALAGGAGRLGHAQPWDADMTATAQRIALMESIHLTAVARAAAAAPPKGSADDRAQL